MAMCIAVRKVMRIAICIAMGSVLGRSDGALPFFSVCVHRTYNISVCRGNISVAADKFQMRTTSPHLYRSTSAPPASSFLSAGEMTRAINQPQGATRLERVQPASSKGPVGDLGVFGVLGDLRDLGEVLEELGSGENLSSDSGSLGAVICRSVYRHPFRHGISNVRTCTFGIPLVFRRSGLGRYDGTSMGFKVGSDSTSDLPG